MISKTRKPSGQQREVISKFNGVDGWVYKGFSKKYPDNIMMLNNDPEFVKKTVRSLYYVDVNGECNGLPFETYIQDVNDFSMYPEYLKPKDLSANAREEENIDETRKKRSTLKQYMYGLYPGLLNYSYDRFNDSDEEDNADSNDSGVEEGIHKVYNISSRQKDVLKLWKSQYKNEWNIFSLPTKNNQTLSFINIKSDNIINIDANGMDGSLTAKKAFEGYWIDPAGGEHLDNDNEFDDPAGLYTESINHAVPTFDMASFKGHVFELYKYMMNQFEVLNSSTNAPKISLDKTPQDTFGKTAYYDPENKHVCLFIHNRHPKDILRSLAHEVIHHVQNLEGRLPSSMNTSEGYAQKDETLRKLEEEAFLKGNMCFRDWTDTRKK